MSFGLHALGWWGLRSPLWPGLAFAAMAFVVALAGLPLVYGIPARFRENAYLRGVGGLYRWLHRLDLATTGYALCYLALDLAGEEVARTTRGDQRLLFILVAWLLVSSTKWLALVVHVRTTERLEA